MAEYFLSDVDKLEEKPCAYECRILERKDFADLYVPEYRRRGLATALTSKPAWVEMTAKPVELVDKLNKRDS